MDLNFLIKYSHFFISGTKITIIISIFTIIIGVTLGIIFAIMRISKNVVLHSVAAGYIEFIRGTPLLVQLYIIYYGLPLLGIQLPSISMVSSNFSDILAAIMALSINSSAYSAEIFRAGIQAVDKGQMEAARSLGMPYKTAMLHIILPQALKNVLPAIGNEFVSIIKESAIVSVIGIHELMFNADTVRGITFRPFSPLVISAIIYFIITFTLSKLIKSGERRLNTND